MTPAPATPGPPRFGSRAFTAVLAVVAVAHVASFGVFLYRTAILPPISDMFDYIAFYLSYRDGTLSWPEYFWHPHGEHRLVWTRLLTWADVGLFGTSGTVFIVVATGFMLGAAVAVWRPLASALGRAGIARPWALFAPMLLLTTANVIDCSVPINTTYAATVFFTVTAIVLFGTAERCGPHQLTARVAAAFAGVGASLATGAGLAVWPVLIWSAWQGRVGVRPTIGLAVAAVLLLLVYLPGMPVYGLAPVLAKDTTALFAPDHVAKLGGYLLSFLGMPIARDPAFEAVGRILGAIVLVAGVSTLAWSALSRHAGSTADRIGVGLILFGLAAAVLATFGRSELEPKVPVRYGVFTSLLQIGLLYVALPRLLAAAARAGESVGIPGRERASELASGVARRRDAAVYAAGTAIAALLLAQQVVGGRAAERIATTISVEAGCFAEALEPPSETITKAPERAGQVLAALRARGLLPPRPNWCPGASSSGRPARPL